MVHRDLKPGNLFVAKLPDGSASLKIVDFGISKHIGGSARNQAATTSAQVLGSPYYMPPEQMRAEPVDERSDIWSLGAILFEMLTGRPPFLGETLPEVYAGVLSGSVPSVESLRPGIPGGLDDIVQRCLDKDPAQRFCDVADLAEALAPFGGPSSAQSVERITRILTNPELFRARTSNAPRASVSAEPQLASGTARGGIAVDPQLVLTPNRITPSRVVDAGGASSLNAAPLPAALVSPAMASQARRAPTSSEFGPLSATGSLEGLEPPTATRRNRVLWAAAALVALVGAGLLSLRGGSEPTAHPAAAQLPLPGSLTEADTSPAERNGADPEARQAGEVLGSPELQTEKQGLKPAPPRAPVISIDASRAAPNKQPVRASSDRPSDGKSKNRQPPGKIAASSAAAPSGPARSESRGEGRSASESGVPAETAPATNRSGNAAREEDPWNPSTFGDRR
jgi:Protein kinase domain